MSHDAGNGQVIDRVRQKTGALCENVACGEEALVLTDQDIRFIAMCRVIGHGEINSLTIHDGHPAIAKTIFERIDFSPHLTNK